MKSWPPLCDNFHSRSVERKSRLGMWNGDKIRQKIPQLERGLGHRDEASGVFSRPETDLLLSWCSFLSVATATEHGRLFVEVNCVNSGCLFDKQRRCGSRDTEDSGRDIIFSGSFFRLLISKQNAIEFGNSLSITPKPLSTEQRSSSNFEQTRLPEFLRDSLKGARASRPKPSRHFK